MMARSSQHEPASKGDAGAETTMPQRLEFVRETIAGGMSLLEFWIGLGFGPDVKGEDGVSYAAARRYHLDREAPARYLIAVSDVWGVDIGWLVSGRGEPSKGSGGGSGVLFDDHPGFKDAIIEAFPAAFIEDVRRAVVDTWMRWPFDEDTIPEEEKAAVIERLPDTGVYEWERHWSLWAVARAFNEPFIRLGIDASKVPILNLATYAFLMSEAIRAVAVPRSPLRTLTLEQAYRMGISRTTDVSAWTVDVPEQQGMEIIPMTGVVYRVSGEIPEASRTDGHAESGAPRTERQGRAEAQKNIVLPAPMTEEHIEKMCRWLESQGWTVERHRGKPNG